jgi:hypothetical protein
VSPYDYPGIETNASGAIASMVGPELCPCLGFHGKTRRPRGLIDCEILRAIDRPDCFRMELLDEEPYFVDPRHEVETDDDLPLPGTPTFVSVGLAKLASGRIEEIGLHEERGGARVSLVATASFDSLRGGNPQRGWVKSEDFRDMTVSEIARRVALSLGLKARVDPHDSVVNDFDVGDDPLKSLRDLSRASSMGLALVGDSLCLVRDLPAPRQTYVLGRSVTCGFVNFCVRQLVGVEAPRRLVEISLAGAVTAGLLDRVCFEGYGPRRDGTYRLVRCRTRLTGDGWCSDLLLSEEGPASICLDLPPGAEVDG